MDSVLQLSAEQDLPEHYLHSIEPFWAEQVIQGQFQALDKINIAYAYVVHPQPVGCIVISSGRIEAYLKYKEVVFDLYQNGYSVFIHDHRGQGLSGRMTDNAHMGYVDDFARYVDDFELFIQLVVSPAASAPLLLLCHSMGSTIGALYCLKHPGRFSKVVFSAPMFGIRPALPRWFVSLLIHSHLKIGRCFGRQYGYFLGQTDYVEHAFAGNSLTHSEGRYRIFRQEYASQPQIQLGGVSAHWLHAAVKAMDYIEQHCGQLAIPALVIQAGADQVVDNQRQARVVKNMPTATLLTVARARHELLMEADEFRLPVFNALLKFFAKAQPSQL